MIMKINKIVFMVLFFGLVLLNSTVFANQKFIGKTFFTRSTMWVDDGFVSSVNYKTGDKIPVETEVKITHFTDKEIEFIIKTTERKIVLRIDERMSFLSIEQIFQRYFDSMSPTKAGIYRVFNEDEIEAIKQGTIVKGMSKAALLMSYGYPPSHKTNIDKDHTWTYWISPSQIQVLTFEHGALTKIYPTPNEIEPVGKQEHPEVKVDIKFFDQFDNEILKDKRESAEEKYKVIPSELSYSEVVNDITELQILDLDKTVDDLPLGGTLADVSHWCRAEQVNTIADTSLVELKKEMFDLLIPVGVEKNRLNKWGYGAITHAMNDESARLNHDPSDFEKAERLYKKFSQPKFVYYENMYFLSPFANERFGSSLEESRYTLTVRDSHKFSDVGINKVVFYFIKHYDELTVYAVEVFFAVTPDDYIVQLDNKYEAHDLIPGDSELGIKVAFDDYVNRLLIDSVPSDLLSYIWGGNLFLIPDATLHEYSSKNSEFYKTRLFDSYFLKSIGLGHRNHYRLVFVDDTFAKKNLDDLIAEHKIEAEDVI